MPFENSFYNIDELKKIGFKSFGTNLMISRKASFYNPENIEIGNNVRIDDFCILSGNIILGSNIHISAYCGLYGKFGIELCDFSGLSPRCTVFSATDDFSGDYLIGPMISSEFTNIYGGSVKLNKFVQVGAGCIIMPNVELLEGSVIGAMSLVNKTTQPWGIYAGIPTKYIKERKKGLLEFAKKIK